MNLEHELVRAINRRYFFGRCGAGLGLGAIALASLLRRRGAGRVSTSLQRSGASTTRWPPESLRSLPGPSTSSTCTWPVRPASLISSTTSPRCASTTASPAPRNCSRASGSPSSPACPICWARRSSSLATARPAPSSASSGPTCPGVIDDFAVVKSMQTDQFNHAPAQLFLHTGTTQFGGASLGAWATYGLGTENQRSARLRGPDQRRQDARRRQERLGQRLSSLGLSGRSVPLAGRSRALPLESPGHGSRRPAQTLDTLNQLNAWQAEAIGDPETLTRISQYELAFRMQLSCPSSWISPASRSTSSTCTVPGPGFVPDSDAAADPRVAYKGTDAAFANNCLLARRLIEAGVRFVQLYDWGWDHHGVSPGEDIPNTSAHQGSAGRSGALAGLVRDLKQRGLFDETLIVWGGEFGRTPMAQNSPSQPFIGRDHHPYAFTVLLAGGGIKGGQTFGRTDDIGYYVTENPDGCPRPPGAGPALAWPRSLEADLRYTRACSSG